MSKNAPKLPQITLGQAVGSTLEHIYLYVPSVDPTPWAAIRGGTPPERERERNSLGLVLYRGMGGIGPENVA